MQLLHSRSTPSPEFVSLSLLFKGDIAGEEIAFRIIEPLLLPSTVATISQVTCVEALTELHQYINAVVRASRSRKDKQTSKVASVLLQEDEKLLNDIQVFRPLKGNGIGLHYRVIRHRSTISNLVPLIFDASRATASANKGTESEVTGVVLCLGMAGLPSSVVMSPLHYSISQRMRDCVNILNRVGSKNVEASKDLLATLLLTEDEDRITNTMAEGFRSNFLSADDLVARTKIKSRGRTSTTKKNKRATPLEPDDEFGFSKTSADQARIMVERLAVLSVAETDTILRKFEMKDDKVIKKRRTAADLDGFDFRGERISSSRDSVSGATGIRSSANIYKQDIRADSGARQRIAALSAPGRDTNPKHSGRHSLDPFVGNVSRDTMAVGETSVDSGGNFREYESGNPRFQVNLALNEDLTCFYKQSRMSSCSVEGLIQVQVKSNTKPGFPFYLFIRDPSGHIQSIQENRKFAEIVDAAGEPDIDYLFAVSVPQPDSYFPVMRYKCDSELRPVPIRVQSRVRLEEAHWRVALQISSNPHNEYNLTDLTIIMGVPPMVNGESLTTSPPGGVWNASKRSVIWCVSELGGGEKFQLQARFEIDDESRSEGDEEPKFPVLVRCTCMHAQLTDVELEVSDIPEAFPAEVRMKLARRFRLSHRERS